MSPLKEPDVELCMIGLWHLRPRDDRIMPAQTKHTLSAWTFAFSSDLRKSGAHFRPSLLRASRSKNELHMNPQVLEAGGLQTLLTLLPAPGASPASADAASATAAATAAVTVAAPSWTNKPASHRLQASLLQLLAALMQSQQARSLLLAANSNSYVSSSSCVAVLLNILDPHASGDPAATPAAVVAPTGGKGGAVGKADGKAKAAGKSKPEAPAGPPAELVPPFPVSVQLPAVHCLQVTHPSLS